MELVKKLRLKSKLLEQETPEQEHNDWSNLGIQNLANAYKSDEPDIDDLLLKEPNPEYNPWKKGVL